MNISEMTQEEIRQAGIEALTEKLGPAGFVRFLRQFNYGNGNYTKERSDILKDYSSEVIINKIGLQN